MQLIELTVLFTFTLAQVLQPVPPPLACIRSGTAHFEVQIPVQCPNDPAGAQAGRSVNLLLLTTTTTSAKGGPHSIDNVKKLHNDLLKGYNQDIRPVRKQDRAVVVYFDVAIVEVADLDQENGKMTIAAWLRMSWADENLRWNPSRYGDVEKAMLPANKIWLPDIRLYNGLDTVVDKTVSTSVLRDGTVTWITPAKYTLTCRHEFRHNAWSCPFIFSSWTYNGDEMDIAPWPGREGKTDFDVEQFRESDYYAVVDHEGVRTMKKFSCCREPYPAMEYLLKLRNKMGPSLLGK